MNFAYTDDGNQELANRARAPQRMYPRASIFSRIF